MNCTEAYSESRASAAKEILIGKLRVPKAPKLRPTKAPMKVVQVLVLPPNCFNQILSSLIDSYFLAKPALKGR